MPEDGDPVGSEEDPRETNTAGHFYYMTISDSYENVRL
jgi:hypothetical protein